MVNLEMKLGNEKMEIPLGSGMLNTTLPYFELDEVITGAMTLSNSFGSFNNPEKK